MMCEWDTAQLLIFSGNGEPLIYYSHLTSISIFLGLLIFTFLHLRQWPKNPFRLMAGSYVVWLFCDLVLWGNEGINNVMFFWTLINLVEPLIFVGAYIYFLQFIEGKVISRGNLITIGFLLLPTVLMAPLGLSVFGFDHSTCDRNVIESIAAYYNYFLEAVFIGLITIKTITSAYGKYQKQRTKLFLLSGSISLLLFSFLVANFLGTITGDYVTSQYGHIAVPFFAALLAYVTIKYESFEPRILFVDTLLVALIIILASLLFVENPNYQIYANFIAFVLAVPLGYTLMKNMRKEVRQRKDIESLALNLEKINKQQEGLIHFISHEVKGYLTKSAGVFAGIIEGDYGKSNITLDTVAKGALLETRKGIDEVINILKASNLKKGTVEYKMEPFDLSVTLKKKAIDLETFAETRGLTFSLSIQEGVDFIIKGDEEHLGGHVVRNVIENAINYTPKGSVSVTLKKEGNKAVLSVQDTGVGITEEDKQRLFTEGGHGKDSIKVNVHSTGYGLYIAKSIVEAHGGTISAHSEGPGKGSTFVIELPM